MKIHKFRNLQVWQKAMLFVSHVYRISRGFPKNELYGLTDQLRRASATIVLNIAEGSGSGSDKEFARFLRISLRSSYEVVTAVEIAKMLSYGDIHELDKLLDEVDELSAMMTGLLKRLSIVG